jgi:hypothetical protein
LYLSVFEQPVSRAFFNILLIFRELPPTDIPAAASVHPGYPCTQPVRSLAGKDRKSVV